MNEEVPKPPWCQMETLTLPSPALTVIASNPKHCQDSTVWPAFWFFKRKWKTSLKQIQKSPALPSRTDIRQDCSSFTWLSLCGPQAPSQELVLEHEAQKNFCRREILAYHSQYKQPAFNSQGKNLASQSSHPSELFHITDASPPQLVLSFIGVSRKGRNNVGKENSLWSMHSLFWRVKAWLGCRAKHTLNFIAGWSDPNKTNPEPASTTGTLMTKTD